MPFAAALFIAAAAKEPRNSRHGQHRTALRETKGVDPFSLSGSDTASRFVRTADSTFVDPGALWTIRVARNGRYMYKDGNRAHLISCKHFFSLIEINRGSPRGVPVWLAEHVTQQPLRLHVSGPSELLSVGPAKRKRRWIHTFWPPSPPPPPFAGPPASVPLDAQAFRIQQVGDGLVTLNLAHEPNKYICETATHELAAVEGSRGRRSRKWRAANSSLPGPECLFQLRRMGESTSLADSSGARHMSLATGRRKYLKRRVRQTSIRSQGRDIAVVTSLDVDAMDWFHLFISWLQASDLLSLWVVHTDSITGSAVRSLNTSVRIECITPIELGMPSIVMEGNELNMDWARHGHDWGIVAPGDSILLRRCKLRFLEILLLMGFDALYLDVRTFVISPKFFETIVRSTRDLSIASDARAGMFDDQHCPASPSMYQKYSADWISSALFFLRCTPASSWFLREAQTVMDAYAVLDADAFQAILTGHAQISDPLHARRPHTIANMSKSKAFQSSMWLKPLWLEQENDEHQARGLAMQPGIRPLNAPLKWKQWRQLSSRARAQGFQWEPLAMERHGNGPAMVAQWQAVFGRAFGSARVGGDRNGGYHSIRVSCNTKGWLVHAPSSFLLRPERDEDTLAVAFDEGWEQALSAIATVSG